MNPADHNHSPERAADRRFATDLEFADAEAAPARSADSLVVHGMLSMVAADEPARLEARIGRAIAAVHAESAPTSPLGRIGPSAHGLGGAHSFRSRHVAWRRRIALAGGGIGIAAVLGFAVLFTPSGQSPSGSQAYAALDSIRAAAVNAEGRAYRVRIERGPDREPVHDAPRDPRRGDMREPGHPWRDAMREGDLVIGAGRRYVLSWRIPGKPSGMRMGFDGQTYWAILPDGTIRSADSPMALRIPPLFMAADPGTPEDGDSEQLTLDAILTRLERGYEVTFANGVDPIPTLRQVARPEGPADRAGTEAAAPTIQVLATRRGGPRGRGTRPDGPPEGAPPRRASRPDRPEHGPDRPPPPGPDSVRVVADATTFDVQRLYAEWSAGPLRSMTIERIVPAVPIPIEPSWFSADVQRDRRDGAPAADR